MAQGATNMGLAETIKLARGEEKADLLLRNARVVNVFSHEIIETSIAIAGDRIVGLGDYPAKEIIDLKGRTVCAGFIDGHVHIESSMVTPLEFAKAVVPRGTTSVVTDPHEITNVLGIEGVRCMLDASEGLPLTVFVMAPSCVPATHLETSGAELLWNDLAPLLQHPRVLGLAEMMNFPGVVSGVPEVLDKIRPLRRPLARPVGQRSASLRRRWHQLGSRVHHPGGGAPEAPSGHVHHDPRRNDGP